jgi:hypothetical protein
VVVDRCRVLGDDPYVGGGQTVVRIATDQRGRSGRVLVRGEGLVQVLPEPDRRRLLVVVDLDEAGRVARLLQGATTTATC